MKNLLLIFFVGISSGTLVAAEKTAPNLKLCLSGDRIVCDEVLRGFSKTQDLKAFTAAYAQVCKEAKLSMKCEAIKVEGNANLTIGKAAQKDAKGAFYYFVKAKPDTVYHVTPVR